MTRRHGGMLWRGRGRRGWSFRSLCMRRGLRLGFRWRRRRGGGLFLAIFVTRTSGSFNLRFRLALGARTGTGLSVKPPAQLLGDVIVHRRRVRLLLQDAQLGQHVDNRAGLHFQFSGQLIDSNFLHTEDSAPAASP